MSDVDDWNAGIIEELRENGGKVGGPKAAIEVGADRVEVTARVTEGEERERIWSKQRLDYPGFAEYEQKTTRPIPVVVLGPV